VTIDLFGPEAVPVSRFRALDSEKAMTTNDTSGPLFTHSSPSADLQRSLENRLRARMDVSGSPEYALIWKVWDMPSGPPICALRASARRTSGNDCGGWPTPRKTDVTSGRTLDEKGRRISQSSSLVFGANLADQVRGVSGKVNTSPAPTEKRGSLNPAFSLWLMGFPTGWARCAALVTRLSRKSRQSS
jgi:hypothetical protein